MGGDPPEIQEQGSDADHATHVAVGKRVRSETPGESGKGDKDNSDNAKRVRTASQSTPLPSNYLPKYLVVNEVYCSNDDDHAHHQQQAQFFDTPGLFADDSKASTLRGRRGIPEDLDEYLEGRPDIGFVVTKDYSCDSYYIDQGQSFRMHSNGTSSSLSVSEC